MLDTDSCRSLYLSRQPTAWLHVNQNLNMTGYINSFLSKRTYTDFLHCVYRFALVYMH